MRRSARSSRPPAPASTSDWPDASVLAYKPRRRAVLRLGGDVVKFYAKEDEFAAAAHGLQRVRALHRRPRPAPGVCSRPGASPSRAPPRQAAPPRGGGGGRRAPARRAPPSSPGPLPPAPPGDQLEAAAATAGLIAALSDTLGHRAEALLGRLARELPLGVPLVTAHGDFNSRQLLASDDGLALVDFDALCRAPGGARPRDLRGVRGARRGARARAARGGARRPR